MYKLEDFATGEIQKFPTLQKMMAAKRAKEWVIGFSPDSTSLKYMFVCSGSGRGLAINPYGTWTNKENQTKHKAKYFKFEDKRTLFLWMMV